MQRLLITILTLFSLVSVNASAAKMPSPEQMIERLILELNLSQEQQSQTENIMQAFGDELTSLRENEASRREKGGKMRAAAEARDEKMQDILDDEQFEKYQELMAQSRGQMKHKGR